MNDQTPNEITKARLWWRPLSLLIIVITLFLLATELGLDQYFKDLQPWIAASGFWGAAAFFLLYIGAVILAVPATPLGLLAGALFGSLQGVIFISVASTIGAALTFLIARYFARDAVSRWLASNDRYRRIDDLTKKHGMIMVAIARLIPFFPFNIINYAFGLTAVKFRTYLFWSWLCMLPGTILFVVGADAIKIALTGGQVPEQLIIILILALIATILLTILANHYLKRKEPPQDHP
jgi:uncharacterized membrane protein YdjX (TVP38/TMEM64 family)